MQEDKNTFLAHAEEITVELLDSDTLTVSRQQNNTIIIRVTEKDVVKSLIYSPPGTRSLEMLLNERPRSDEKDYRFVVRAHDITCDDYYLSFEEGSKLAKFLFTMGRVVRK